MILLSIQPFLTEFLLTDNLVASICLDTDKKECKVITSSLTIGCMVASIRAGPPRGLGGGGQGKYKNWGPTKWGVLASFVQWPRKIGVVVVSC